MGIIILKMALFVIQKVNLAQKCFLNHDNVNKWWDFWSLQWTHFTSVHVGIWPTSGLMRELFHRLENLYFCGHHKKNCHHWGYQQARIKKYIYFTLEKHYQDEHLNALSFTLAFNMCPLHMFMYLSGAEQSLLFSFAVFLLVTVLRKSIKK